MEVHHHAHTARKRWTHYFWEFFMLFLAVFCGMFAEYKLEHIIEHQREKKYIRSLITDIEMDIASLNRSNENRKKQIVYFDSLLYLLRYGMENRMNDVYFYARHITRYTGFQYHDRTIQQLKNSGNMRLIRNKNAADSITVYDNEKMKTSLSQLEGEREMRRFISLNIAGKIFNSFAWNELTDSTTTIIRPIYSPPLLTKDSMLLHEFSFKIVTLKGTLTLTNRVNAGTVAAGQNLISLLKKEYDLD